MRLLLEGKIDFHPTHNVSETFQSVQRSPRTNPRHRLYQDDLQLQGSKYLGAFLLASTSKRKRDE